MTILRLGLLGAAFLACAAFSSDMAGRVCVQKKGERGVAYDIYKTRVTDAYGPTGRRLIEDGHRLYNVEVPPLVKRDKPVTCTMSLADDLWRSPSLDSFNPRERRAQDYR